jgi:hypothetical protein
MKSTLRIKKINGIEYWYEDVPYYDKEKKQIRHRSKYVGRNVNGKPVRVRDVLNSNDNAAVEKLNAEDTKSATDELNFLIKQIEAYIDGGKLSSTEGKALIDTANCVINALRCLIRVMEELLQAPR